MGFNLHCCVTTCQGDADAEAVLAALRAHLPHAKVRRLREPFDGAVAAYDPDDLWEQVEPDPARFGYPDEEAAYEAVYGGIEAALPALSRAFPGRAFGFIGVDCFGGTCLYRGSAARDGASFFHTGAGGQDGHQQVLQAIGAPHADWHFPPFTRGFFEGEPPPPGPPRRPITARLQGTVRGLGVAGLWAALSRDLAAPWQVSVMGATLLVCHGEEDVFFSLNPRGEALALDGRCHAPPEEAARLIETLVKAELADLGLDYELDLRTFEGAPLRTWKSS